MTSRRLASSSVSVAPSMRARTSGQIADIQARLRASLDNHRVWIHGYMEASLSTVSGNRFTRLISKAAWALGFARPCSQFSSVRTLVRR
jgi:hypothetical protein